MDQIQLCQDREALQKLSEEYDRQLKLTGIELSDMPDDCVNLIDRYAEIKSTTQLHDLSKSFLDEFYFTRKRDRIEHIQNTSQLESENKALEEAIESEKRNNKILEDFINSVNSRIVSEAEMDRTKATIQRQIESLRSKHTSTCDVDIDSLIAKIAMLEARKK